MKTHPLIISDYTWVLPEGPEMTTRCGGYECTAMQKYYGTKGTIVGNEVL